MNNNSPKILLLYPPVTDPTSPYHSLVYIASYARSRGFTNVEIRDTNIEAFNYCARPEVLKRQMKDWETRRQNFAAKPFLSRKEQLEYLNLVKVTEGVTPEEITTAITSLRSEKCFYDYSIYKNAVRKIQLWMDGLSCEAFPGQFNGFKLSSEGQFSLSSIADLSNEVILDQVVGAFKEYYQEEFFPYIKHKQFDVIGINVTYTSQLPYTLWLVRNIRNLLPDCHIVCGGTEVSDVWKYIIDKELFPKLFHGASSCVIGEGESAFVSILEAVSAGKIPDDTANVICLNGKHEYSPRSGITYEDLNTVPTPEYSLMRSDLYFSPHTLVYYSPTRGCYWNKCTFCDYGLNFGTPTSPWRQRSLDQVILDLKIISQQFQFVYLSVDVLAPSALLSLAESIINAGINIRWAAEIRLEKYFTEERCEMLRRSGCVAVSVGFESGCQRILDKIQKGTKLDNIEITLRNFSTAKIAVQMMGFTNFPTESYEEALESIEYLKRNDAYWSVGGLGSFSLTPGAIAAQHPQDFSLCDVHPLTGDDISRVLSYKDNSVTAKTPDQLLAIEETKKVLSRTEFDRPFAGGIDCAHSIFWYNKYGLSFPHNFHTRRIETATSYNDDLPVMLNGKLILHDSYNLLSLFDTNDLTEMHVKSRREDGVSIGAENLKTWFEVDEGKAFPVTEQNPYFLRSDGILIPCSAELLNLILNVDGKRSLSEILDIVSQGNSDQEITYSLLRYLMERFQIIISSANAVRRVAVQ